ncbi:amino acid adenylation domain-containing protein [Streptomyces sp. NBC_01267]|uniref:non-ribosomal peptide synthetase n=1 Tax=unclassified Streptomyces TaxID=2593676 RepID=UPI002E3118B1|nr:non-ribosomal peptide synthetase [Streptomyces sp. NBC_01267]WSV56462.1 amino acid adenylation domain-containing protein [Streptomyces sp. NBC_01014]
MSSAQQRLWFLQGMEPEGTAYHVKEVFRVSGPLDFVALSRAVDALVARHASFRTRFVEAAGVPSQVIEEAPADCESAGVLARNDMESDFARDGEGAVREFVDQVADEPFDLGTGPLLRLRLGRLAPQDHVLVVVAHHIVCDGWSMGLLLSELSELYRAERAGEPAELAEPDLQYVDFAVWERELLDAERTAEYLDYWTGHLSGAPALLQLPADKARTAALFPVSGICEFTVPDAVLKGLQALGNSSRSSMFMVLLASFQAFLSRLTGAEDLVVGVPLSGRTQEGAESVIGMFVNTLAIRGDLRNDPTVREFVARTRENVLAGQENGELPFERLVEALNPDRVSGVNPLVQVMFQLLDSEFSGELLLDGARAEKVLTPQQTTLFDLSLDMIHDEQGLRGSFNYSVDLFEAETVSRFAGYFLTLLTALAESGSARVSDLPLLRPGTERAVLDQYGRGPSVDVAPGATVLGFLHEQVAAQPQEVALEDADHQWTFGELGDAVDAVAAELGRRGVGRGDCVGLMAGRSGRLFIGMLGIIRAGAVLVPLDAKLSPERFRHMIEAAGVSLLVVDSGVGPEAVASSVPRLDLKGVAPLAQPLELALPQPSDLAYTVFTSGSTGLPKGVLVRHDSLANLFCSHRGSHFAAMAQFAGDVRLRVAHTLSISFDASWDQLLWMVDGHRLLVVDDETCRDTQLLLDFLRQERIDVLESTPSQLEQLVELGLLEGGHRPSLMVLGGEAVRPSLWARLAADPGVLAVNLYGPTEFTVDALGRTIAEGTVPVIGRPLARTQVLILGARGELVPPGVVGELYLSGPQLAVGYVGDPVQTAVRFVPNPYSDEPGARMYRTGDLGRFTVDGDVEFLGRADQQVKIRGYRIEPGEIESALLGHPCVRDVAVVARPDQHGRPRLISYAVATGVTSSELRDYSAGLLPDYMVPSAFVQVPEIPRNVSGKVSAAELPDPGEESFHVDYVAPRPGAEQVIAELFAEVLGVENVGSRDDFFHLGGHSLAAVRLATRIHTVMGTRILLQVLFENPTVAGLAALVQSESASEEPIPVLAGRTSGTMSFAQQRLWFVQQAALENATYNMVEAFRLDGELDIAAMSKAITAMVVRHEVLQTSYGAGDRFPLQTVDRDWRPDIVLLDLSGLDAEQAAERTRAFVLDVRAREYDLSRGPVFEAAVVKLAPTEHLLVFGIHHIACDGWSVKVILSEISELYRVYAEGGVPDLPRPSVQYLDFAVWERDPQRQRERAGQLRHYADELAEVPLTLELPLDHPRPPVRTGKGGTVRFTLSPEVTEALTTLGLRHRNTLFNVLLASFQVLVSRWSGQRDLLVGVPVAGRNRAELEGLVGFFVNTLPVRGDLRDDPTFEELLSQVRQATLSAYAHQDVPFDRLVEALNPARDLGVNPLVQVTCQLLEGEVAADLRLDGISVSPYQVDVASSRFDLSLDLSRHDGGLRGDLVYDADLFENASMGRLAECFQTLLHEVVRDPGRQVSELPLLSDAAAERLVREYGRGVRVPVTADTVIDALRARVQANPDQIALVDGDRAWSLAELEQAMDRLAARLRQEGTVPGEVVALSAERTAELVVGLLGIMSSGAVALPLDPAHPQERVAAMLTLAGVRRSVADAPDHRLQTTTTITFPGPADPLDITGTPGPSPSDPAYLAFTSGSTGLPKGVLISHGALANLLATHSARPVPAGRRLRVAHTASFAFDAAWDQLLWMIAGHELHIVGEETRTDAEALVEFTRQHAIDVLNVPPSFAEQLVEFGLLEGGHRPSLMVLGGEAVRPSLWARLAADPGVLAVNLYGPTEFTVASVHAVIAEGTVPVIGRPLARTQVLILGARGELVPPGVVGELYLSGPQLAVGYVGDPVQTAVRFVPNPYSDEPGARMYRTGDLGRFTVDGDVEFLGRADQQVKIRGYRIEPGEIESALLGHPCVRDVAVVARPDQHGRPRLISYVVPDERVDMSAERAAFVDSWLSVFEDTHETVKFAAQDADAAIKGWTDSFTGQDIPAPQMREWVSTTVDRIVALKPGRLLEIGAGTGLLVRPLCERADLSLYVATDFSEPSVELLNRIADEVRAGSPGLRLVAGRAEALGAPGLVDGAYDTVVINSVAQYFPSLMYVEQVIEEALPRLTAGGHIFLGDLRNGALLEAFFSLRQFLRNGADPDMRLADQVAQAIQADGELSIDPRYFVSLLDRLPRITGVEIAPRRGTSPNEMTLFRYDVILHVDCANEPGAEGWETKVPGFRQIEARLAVGTEPFGYRRVPNARLEEALRLRDAYGFTVAGEERPADLRGIDPESLWALGERYGWTTRIGWGQGDAYGTMDVCFSPPGRLGHFTTSDPLTRSGSGPAAVPRVRLLAPWMERKLTSVLRESLAGRLPDFMVPHEFVYLTDLTRSVSGKVSLSALPDSLRAYVPLAAEPSGAPAGDQADVIARVMGARLGVAALGRNDDFFAAGGDSLTAAMSVRDLRELGLNLSIRDVFRHKTPQQVSECLPQPVEDGR